MRMLKFVIIYIFAITNSFASSDDTVYAPFGLKSRQPPTSGTIRLIDASIDITANQVCGYTDWTTAQIRLPKQLLTKQYWSKVAKNIENQAVKAVTDVSGALPGMIACNMSPTWCQVMNQSEIMAGMETNLTWNTCNALEGVNNAVKYGSVILAKCIAQKTSSGKITNSEAREICMNENPNEGGSKSASMKATSDTIAKNAFDINKFYDRMFPKEANETDIDKKTARRSVDVNGSYTRIHRERTVSDMIFPGLSIDSTQVVVNGGTFSPAVESMQEKENYEAKTYIINMVNGLYDKYILKGKTAKQALKECVDDNFCTWGKQCRGLDCTWDLSVYKTNNKKIPPIVLEASDSTGNLSFLVSPEQLIAMTAILSDHNRAIATVKLDLAAERLASSISYTKMLGTLSSLQKRHKEPCRSPEFSDEIWQKFCTDYSNNINDEILYLQNKRQNEDSALKNQQIVNEMINSDRELDDDNITVDERPSQSNTPSSIK